MEEKLVSHAYFAELDIRIATVTTAEKVQGADKLLKLGIKIGSEQRTLAAGIAKFYSPEQLIGKKIVVITNLEPRVLKGIESQGMLLAAVEENGKNIVLLTTDAAVADGCKVS